MKTNGEDKCCAFVWKFWLCSLSLFSGVLTLQKMWIGGLAKDKFTVDIN